MVGGNCGDCGAMFASGFECHPFGDTSGGGDSSSPNGLFSVVVVVEL